MFSESYLIIFYSLWNDVAVYLRSLRIIAAEEKNIPGPSRELMDCK